MMPSVATCVFPIVGVVWSIVKRLRQITYVVGTECQVVFGIFSRFRSCPVFPDGGDDSSV
jgi:hypothetical protein